ncbi:hypothetical protein BN1058_02815 [Paraliobacillus sp. PM-2]|uniref:hypothetical protein n=1 Tax=Paraliobacillus sp. PM-2 TaxID=1462524 RepID=UPI00061C8879|nr:hypothetical protein [Paraliobacillus sp. PM-2]CQR48446.1 hypothetical protein BN1058_02815 [Paraliobacillus sp. PM-2]
MYSDNLHGYNHLYNDTDLYNWSPQDPSIYSETDEQRQLFPWLPSFGGGQGGPGSPPPFPPPGQEQQSGPPMGPPPGFTPSQTQQAQTFAVDPGSIRGCLYRYTYIWLRGFQQFWFYPTYVGRRSVSGYRWNGFRWIYFGIDLRQIQSFTCF